jgi:hypothetical protein
MKHSPGACWAAHVALRLANIPSELERVELHSNGGISGSRCVREGPARQADPPECQSETDRGQVMAERGRHVSGDRCMGCRFQRLCSE